MCRVKTKNKKQNMSVKKNLKKNGKLKSRSYPDKLKEVWNFHEYLAGKLSC